MRVVPSLLTVVLLLASCSSQRVVPASTPDQSTVRVVGTQGGLVTQIATTSTSRPRVVTLEMSRADIWTRLPAAYAALGIPLTVSNERSGVIGNQGLRARGRIGGTRISLYLDCGSTQGAPSADTYDVHLSVLTELQSSEAEKTVVITIVDATAKPVNFAGESVRCASRGELENRILEHVRRGGAQ